MTDMFDVLTHPFNSLKKKGSKEIVDSFLDSNMKSASINVKKVNRSAESIYTSLKIYLKNHPEENITVTKRGNDIILCRETNDEDDNETESA